MHSQITWGFTSYKSFIMPKGVIRTEMKFLTHEILYFGFLFHFNVIL